MKLPDIVQQPVGEYALGNIPVPRYDELGKAVGRAGAAFLETSTKLIIEKDVGDVDTATGEAAKELSELKTKLVEENIVDSEWVGDDALGEIQLSTTQNGERDYNPDIKMFTHQIADQVWEKRSKEIVDYYASTISNAEAREKFIGEMNERYVAPGTGAVMAANIIRSRAYGQAQAERAVELILSSSAPTEVRESNAKEIISRQILLGADPAWAEKQVSELGPQIDQIDVQNALINAGTVDELDLIEAQMWTNGNRMTAATQRVMSTQIDSKRKDFLAAEKARQDENADQLFLAYHDPDTPVSVMTVAEMVATSQITREAGWTFINAERGGSTTKASDQFTLSHYRGQIARLQFVGNNMRITDKGIMLKKQIIFGSMGLTPQGVPSGTPATISGVDALTLVKEVDVAVRNALESTQYKDALSSLMLWTRSKLDLQGQITTTFGGNQNQVEAAVAFKRALDNYMNAYGVDAKPSDFVEANKDAYDPRNFHSGINVAFMRQVPQSAPFMTADKKERVFTQEAQEDFAVWLGDAAITLGPEESAKINQLFEQYYQGKGVAPDDGALMLEPEDPLYWQFQQAIQDVE